MNEYAIELNSLWMIFEAGWKVKNIYIELKGGSSIEGATTTPAYQQ